MMEFANSERKGSANSQLKCQNEELAFRKQCIILVGSSNTKSIIFSEAPWLFFGIKKFQI